MGDKERLATERFNRAEALAWWKKEKKRGQLSKGQWKQLRAREEQQREEQVRKEARRGIAALKPVVALYKHEERYRGQEEHQARCWRCRRVGGWQRRDRRVMREWRQRKRLGKAVFVRKVQMGRFGPTMLDD